MSIKPDIKKIFKLAQELRQKYDIKGKLSEKDLEKITAELDIQISQDNNLPSDIRSLLVKEKEQRFNIIYNSDLSLSRRLFTIGHELGHIFLHFHDTHIQKAVWENQQQELMLSEYEANLFANKLLFGDDLKPIVHTLEYIITETEEKFRIDPVVRSKPSIYDFEETDLGRAPLSQITVINKNLLKDIYILEEFEELINDPNAPESRFQEFFERNPNYLLGSEYKNLKAHILLSRKDTPDLIPDFFLQSITDQLWDIFEIKRPSDIVIVGPPNRPRFSASVMKACGQLREYKSYFDDPKNRKSIEQKFSIKVYKPNIAVIIGRRSTISPVEFRAAEGDLHELRVITYDDILKKSRAFTKDKVSLFKRK